jgi:hypothetical protein
MPLSLKFILTDIDPNSDAGSKKVNLTKEFALIMILLRNGSSIPPKYQEHWLRLRI